MKVIEAKQKGIIPVDYWGEVQDKCVCGSDFEITRNRKKIWCPNVRCPIKSAYRAEETLHNFGVKGIGFSYLYKMIRENNFKSHLNCLFAGENQHPSSSSLGVIADNIAKMMFILTKRYTYKELVRNICLPGLQDKALKLFKGINSYQDMLDEIQAENGNIYLWVAKKAEVDTTAVEIVNTILEFKNELYLLDQVFQIKPDAKELIMIAVTGEVSLEGIGKLTRKEFLSYINELGAGQLSFKDSKAFGSVKFTVADYPSNHNTYIAGLQRGNIKTANELVQWIKEEVADE